LEPTPSASDEPAASKGWTGSETGWTGQVGAVDGTRTWEGARKHAGFLGSANGEGANGRESSPFAPIRTRDLQAAIASITRALASASGEDVVVLARERAAPRTELSRVA
jgi:hypothetical protein